MRCICQVVNVFVGKLFLVVLYELNWITQELEAKVLEYVNIHMQWPVLSVRWHSHRLSSMETDPQAHSCLK